MAVATQSEEELCINSIRFLAIDAVERQSLVRGYRWAQLHGIVLWDRFMRLIPKSFG